MTKSLFSKLKRGQGTGLSYNKTPPSSNDVVDVHNGVPSQNDQISQPSSNITPLNAQNVKVVPQQNKASAPSPTPSDDYVGPRAVSPEQWDVIFPLDRMGVKKKAAVLYRQGRNADESVVDGEKLYLESKWIDHPSISKRYSIFEAILSNQDIVLDDTIKFELLYLSASSYRIAETNLNSIWSVIQTCKNNRTDLLRKIWMIIAGDMHGKSGFFSDQSLTHHANDNNPKIFAKNRNLIIKLIAKNYARMVCLCAFRIKKQDIALYKEMEEYCKIDEQDANSFMSWACEFHDDETTPIAEQAGPVLDVDRYASEVQHTHNQDSDSHETQYFTDLIT